MFYCISKHYLSLYFKKTVLFLLFTAQIKIFENKLKSHSKKNVCASVQIKGREYFEKKWWRIER